MNHSNWLATVNSPLQLCVCACYVRCLLHAYWSTDDLLPVSGAACLCNEFEFSAYRAKPLLLACTSAVWATFAGYRHCSLPVLYCSLSGSLLHCHVTRLLPTCLLVQALVGIHTALPRHGGRLAKQNGWLRCAASCSCCYC